MREAIITRIVELMTHYGSNPVAHTSRWGTLQDYLYKEVLDGDPTTKRGRKEARTVDPSDVMLLSKLSDRQLLLYFERVCMRFMTQM